jgi:hypothetical protein
MHTYNELQCRRPPPPVATVIGPTPNKPSSPLPQNSQNTQYSQHYYHEGKRDRELETIATLNEDIDALVKPLAELRKAQRPYCLIATEKTAPQHTAAIAAFGAWFKSKTDGGGDDAAACGVGSTMQFDASVQGCGTGVVAARDLAKGERFVSVPRKLFLSEETAAASELSQLYTIDPMLAQMASLRLAVHLYHEKARQKESPWKSYIDALPVSFNLPLFWTRAQLDALQGSPAHLDALRLCKSTARQYLHIRSQLKKCNGVSDEFPFTFDDFRCVLRAIIRVHLFVRRLCACIVTLARPFHSLAHSTQRRWAVAVVITRQHCIKHSTHFRSFSIHHITPQLGRRSRNDATEQRAAQTVGDADADGSGASAANAHAARTRARMGHVQLRCVTQPFFLFLFVFCFSF